MDSERTVRAAKSDSQSTQKAYIAGPMAGKEGFNFDAFNEAEEYIREETVYDPVNPAKDGDLDDSGNPTKERHEYMRRAFKELSDCDAIVLLEGWKDSDGARVELHAAVEMELTVKRYTHWSDGSPAVIYTETPETILREAEDLIRGQRNSDYGHPADNFAHTAKMWSGLLGYKLKDDITAEDVAMCMICMKMSREQNQPLRDNLVDIAGYAGTIEMIKEKKGK